MQHAIELLDLKIHVEYLTLLANWHHQQWRDINPGLSLKQRLHSMQAHLNDNFIPTTYIALRDSTLLGSASIVESDMDIRPALTPWLASVYVAPECRNQGLGSMLVRHMAMLARQQNIHSLYLFTPDQQHFYGKLGWRPIERVRYRDQQETIMQIDL